MERQHAVDVYTERNGDAIKDLNIATNRNTWSGEPLSHFVQRQCDHQRRFRQGNVGCGLQKVRVNDSRDSRDIAVSRKALYTQRAVIDKGYFLKANVDGVVVVANGLKVFASMTHAQGSCWHHAAAPQPSHRHIGVGRRQVRQCLLWLAVSLSPRGIGGVPPAASRSVQPHNSLNTVPAQDLANELPVGRADEWL